MCVGVVRVVSVGLRGRLMHARPDQQPGCGGEGGDDPDGGADAGAVGAVGDDVGDQGADPDGPAPEYPACR